MRHSVLDEQLYITGNIYVFYGRPI